jgi:hypothetical protein
VSAQWRRKSCPPREHAGPVELRRKDFHRAQHQCRACGKGIGRTLELGELSPEARGDLKPWLKQNLGLAGGNSKRREREEYYRSDEWHERRDRILERDHDVALGFTPCWNCGEQANTAYHRAGRYPKPGEAFGSEPDDAFLSSCARCNGLERQRRVAGFGPMPGEDLAARAVALRAEKQRAAAQHQVPAAQQVTKGEQMAGGGT